MISPAGIGLAVYGGVFTPDTQLGYSKPIFLFPGRAPVVDPFFEQKLNAYNTAHMAMYEKRTSTMYTTFFGGISRYQWDPASRTFTEFPKVGTKSTPVYLDGMEWSDQISTVSCVMPPGAGHATEAVHPASLPAFVGAEGVFIPDPNLARAATGTDILDLDALESDAKNGYI